MNGVIAGKMSKAGVVGMVASIPIPEVVRNINAFTLGAQSVNPKITTKVVWVNEWFNPPQRNGNRSFFGQQLAQTFCTTTLIHRLS